LKFENINAQNIGGMTLKTRLFAQLMTGVPAPESALNLAAANNEEMMDNVVFRSVGYIPMSYEGYSNSIGHLHYGGGLNLRGYSGYYATNNTEEDTFYIYSGLSGWALNAELEFGQILNPFRNNLARYFDLNTYLFFDAGQLFGTDVQQNSGIRLDAGLGTALTLKAGKYTGLQPLTLRFDVPVFLNRIPSSETDYLAFRYIIGISRAF
jgi:aminopeptidase N